MLRIFQILFILFSFTAIWSVIKKKQEGLLGTKGLFFWVIFWLVVVVAVIWPDSTTVLASKFGIGRGSDFVFYVSIVVIFYILFRLHIKLESIGRDITKITRKIAIEDFEKKL